MSQQAKEVIEVTNIKTWNDVTHSILNQFKRFDSIENVEFTPENKEYSTPHVVCLKVKDCIPEKEVHKIGYRAKNMIQDEFDCDVKASIEHPIQITDENTVVDVTDEKIIKLRWRKKTTGFIPPVDLNGYKLSNYII